MMEMERESVEAFEDRETGQGNGRRGRNKAFAAYDFDDDGGFCHIDCSGGIEFLIGFNA